MHIYHGLVNLFAYGLFQPHWLPYTNTDQYLWHVLTEYEEIHFPRWSTYKKDYRYILLNPSFSMIYTVTQIKVKDLAKSTVSLFLFQVTFTGPLEECWDVVKLYSSSLVVLMDFNDGNYACEMLNFDSHCRMKILILNTARTKSWL